MFTQLLISAAMLLQHTTKIVKKLDDNDMTRWIWCNTDPKLHIQLGYIIVIEIICALLSFRARDLPSYFNETQSIGYATFISSLTISSIFPVYYGRKE